MVSFAELSEPAPEFLELLSHIPPPAYDKKDLLQSRAVVDALPSFPNPFYPGVNDATTIESKVPARDGIDIPIRVYTPNKTKDGELPGLLLFFHGGGWFGGTIEFGHPHCVFLASHGVIVVNVDYRKCPEHPWNQPQDDCYDVYRAIYEAAAAGNTELLSKWGVPAFDSNKVFLAGASAGAQIAVACTILDIESGKQGPIKGLILHALPACDQHVFPADKVDGDDSYIQNKDAPFVPAEDFAQFVAWRNSPPSADKYFSPLVGLGDDELKQFPPTYGTVYGMDCLRDGQLLFQERMKELGVDSWYDAYKGYGHCVFLIGWALKATMTALDDLDTACKKLGVY
ncbi:Esterase [Dactylella cylindrospora]|nr:Esterase [Dactylella cylindrospora]